MDVHRENLLRLQGVVSKAQDLHIYLAKMKPPLAPHLQTNREVLRLTTKDKSASPQPNKLGS